VVILLTLSDTFLFCFCQQNQNFNYRSFSHVFKILQTLFQFRFCLCWRGRANCSNQIFIFATKFLFRETKKVAKFTRRVNTLKTLQQSSTKFRFYSLVQTTVWFKAQWKLSSDVLLFIITSCKIEQNWLKTNHFNSLQKKGLNPRLTLYNSLKDSNGTIQMKHDIQGGGGGGEHNVTQTLFTFWNTVEVKGFVW
jgi:hypothetical protein